jgi:alpha-galactosidase
MQPLRRPPAVRVLPLFLLLPLACALNNGVGQTPIMGWTSWIQTGQGDLWVGSPFNVTARALKDTADRMVSTGLRDLGYKYILLDDGWPACSEFRSSGACETSPPRLPNGQVQVDPNKFPPSSPGKNDGIKVVADYLHSLSMKMGIYTAPHARTCGNYWGLLHNEQQDTAMYASWGIDFIKLDAGCQDDSSLHDGTLITSLRKVRDGLNETGRKIVYYVDAGNGNEAKVFNPMKRAVPNNAYTRSHIPRSLSEAVWSFGPDVAHMWKFWTDRHDSFHNLMSVIQFHATTGIPWWQRRGAISTLDSMTVGRGGYAGGAPGMTEGQYRIEVFHYAILASPMVLSFDLSTLSTPKQAFAKEILTNKEIIAINQDSDAVAGSLIYTMGRNSWATDLWIRPLSDGSFAVALVNKDLTASHSISVRIRGSGPHGGGELSDFTGGPAGGQQGAEVHDVYQKRALGNFSTWFNATVPPMDARLLRFLIF